MPLLKLRCPRSGYGVPRVRLGRRVRPVLRLRFPAQPDLPGRLVRPVQLLPSQDRPELQGPLGLQVPPGQSALLGRQAP